MKKEVPKKKITAVKKVVKKSNIAPKARVLKPRAKASPVPKAKKTPKINTYRRGIAAGLAGALMVLGLASYSYFAQADIAELYAATCLGDWQNPEQAQGLPEGNEDNLSDLTSLTAATLSRDSSGRIYCGGFDSTSMPEGSQVMHVSLVLRLRALETSVAVDTSLLNESGALDPLVSTSTSTSTSTSAITSTSTESVVPEEKTEPEQEPAPEPEPESEPVSFFAKRAFAQELEAPVEPVAEPEPVVEPTPEPEVVPDQETLTEEVPPAEETEVVEETEVTEVEKEVEVEIVSETATDTPEVIVEDDTDTDTGPGQAAIDDGQASTTTATTSESIVGEVLGDTVQAPVPYALISYTVDGENWLQVAELTEDVTGEIKYDLPVGDLETLAHVQVSIQSLRSGLGARDLSLDSVALSVEYGPSVAVDQAAPPESSLPKPFVYTSPGFNASGNEEIVLLDPSEDSCSVEPFISSIHLEWRTPVGVSINATNHGPLEPYRITAGIVPKELAFAMVGDWASTPELEVSISDTAQVSPTSISVPILFETMRGGNQIGRTICQFNIVIEP